MKLKYLIIFVTILFTACYMPSRDGADVPLFQNVEEAQYWIVKNIEYAYDEDIYNRDEWQTPAETVKYGRGDCEDMAILLMYIINTQWEGKPNLVVTEYRGGYHAIVEWKGVYYDSVTSHKIESPIIIWTWSFEMTFSIMKVKNINV
jgi:hypothetical protein